MSRLASALATGRHLAKTHELKLRFMLSGAMNTIVGLGTFPLLMIAFGPRGLNYVFALFISHITSVGFAFCTTKFFTFKSKSNILSEFWKFYTFYLCNFLVNLATLPVLVQVLKFSPIPAQLCFGLVAMTLGYFWHSRVTFRFR